ncbi:DUF2911 domain-containing protein [Rubrivirga sp. IMCC45206]|uniref:DUF2911 domain-containing protein n=1 Tax=Rubrivirga sp. IMCC45206 TaxID=3391614 RepID=UPI00398F9E2E
MIRTLPLVLSLFLVASACAQDGEADMADHANMAADHMEMADIPMRANDEARPSPNAGVMATIGTTTVHVHYGRPSLRGRAYFADGAELAPAGQVWRTGANEAPTITFSDNVMFGGEMVSAGTYALFTIPGDEWTVILNGTAQQWGAFRYDEGEDVVRVTATPMTDAPQAEQFEIRFQDLSEDSATMVLHWGTVGVPVTIQAGM